MSLLKNLETKAGVEGEKDVLGGGGALDSGLYDLTIKVAYVTTSSGGALALNTVFDYNGKEVRQQFWMTSGNDKGNKNTYVGKDNKEHYLPGFLTANSLALLTVGKEISQLDLEEKTIKLYDFEAKGEVPTKVQVFTELTGQTVTAGVQKQTVDKNIDSGQVDSNGRKIYVPSGETRDINEVVKFFRTDDGLTVPEIEAQVTEAKFKNDWDAKYTGKTINKAKGSKDGVTAGAPSAGAKPTKSLFAK
ncbi:hypothetical protein PJM40_0059 [Salmonella phage vB_SenP_UTK0002]|nr:hypothetical protein PJM40_0059 [Salmonella phage vB_SenP_UTK0002]